MDVNKEKFDLLRTVLPRVPLFYKEIHNDSRIITYENHAWVCFDMNRTNRIDMFRARSFDQIAEKCIMQCFDGDAEEALRIYREACAKL